MAFDYGNVRVGDFVEVRRSLEEKGGYPGIVFRVKSGGVDVLVITNAGFEHRRDVWHEDDDRLKTVDLATIQAAGGDRGVFRLYASTSPHFINKLVGRLEGLEKVVADLKRKVAELEKE